MQRSSPHPSLVDSDHILQDLTVRQHLRPHGGLEDVLSASAQSLGYCPRAAFHAMRWLEIDPSTSVGRLRRTELTQLARSIHRFWQHAAAVQPRQAPR